MGLRSAAGSADGAEDKDVALRALTCSALATQDLRAAQATRQLQNAIGQTSGNELLVLQDVPRVQRAAICGNQVCEPGERTIAGPNNLGEQFPADASLACVPACSLSLQNYSC